MGKTLFMSVFTFFLVSFACSGQSSAFNLSTPGRPMLEVNGVTKPELTIDIISVSCDTGLNKLEVTLNNWDPSSVSYKFSDSSLFNPGVRVALYMGPSDSLVKIFDGTITTCSPHFLETIPSTFTFVASGSTLMSNNNYMQFSIGADLLHFEPTLVSQNGTIECTGLTDGNSGILNGTSLSISGVGQRYSRTYIVTKTIHTFDMSRGYKTQFSATSRTSPVILDRAIRSRQ